MSVSRRMMRTLGFCKIASEAFDYDFLVKMYNELVTKVVTRRVPDLYYGNNYKLSYGGINKILKEHVGMLDGMMPTDSIRRAFTNTWNCIWKEFCDTLSLPDSCEHVLNELGILIANNMSNDLDLQSVKQFYNDVIGWYLYANAGCYDAETVLRVLVSSNMNEVRRLYENNNGD